MDHDRKPHHTFLYLWLIGGLLVLGVGMGSALLYPAPARAPIDQTVPVEIVHPIQTSTTTPVTTDSSGVFTLALGETGASHGWTITPIALVEDSRCPSDVQCIQAGTVRVSVRIGTSTAVHTLTLATPESVGAGRITLVNVTPAKTAVTTISAKDYRFSFLVDSK